MGRFKERPYAKTTFFFGGPLVSELERYLPPARNDYVHDGLVSDGGLLGSAFGAAGAKWSARAGGVAGLPGGFLGAGAGAFLGGALGYFGGAYAGHLGVREAELIGNILNNPSSYDVDPLGNPIGPSAFQDQPGTDSIERVGSVWRDVPAINSFVSPFESAHEAVPFMPNQSVPYGTARLSRQSFEDQPARVLRLVPQQQSDVDAPAVMRSLVDRAAASSATPAPPEDTNDLLKLRSIIQAVGSRGIFPIP
jgi:hypothetical protein